MTCSALRRLICLLVSAVFLTAGLPAAEPTDSPFGRWALTLPDGGAGWLEVTRQDGWSDGSILWGGGSVVPVSSVVVSGSELVVTRVRPIERKDASGRIIRTQHVTETITGRVEGDGLRLMRTRPRLDGSGIDEERFTGRRIPPLPRRPDLATLRFGEPVPLFNGRDLTGWRLLEAERENAWGVEDGALVNRPAQVEGQPRKPSGNLRTAAEFEDFRLTLEVNVPDGSNSGVYLRGIYEVQIADTDGKPLDSHHMGAIYSRLTPTVAAERPAGEWQTLDLTLVDRHVTVILNGHTIIDNQPLAGCTGGALWSDQFRPGPIYLQGDHGPVQYRNLVLRPLVR